jgi:hypothetical protein
MSQLSLMACAPSTEIAAVSAPAQCARMGSWHRLAGAISGCPHCGRPQWQRCPISSAVALASAPMNLGAKRIEQMREDGELAGDRIGRPRRPERGRLAILSDLIGRRARQRAFRCCSPRRRRRRHRFRYCPTAGALLRFGGRQQRSRVTHRVGPWLCLTFPAAWRLFETPERMSPSDLPR